jgi:hypothetical protein
MAGRKTTEKVSGEKEKNKGDGKNNKKKTKPVKITRFFDVVTKS